MKLTHQQVFFFRQSGYLRLSHTLPRVMVGGLRRTVTEQMNKRVSPLVEDDEGRVIRLSGIINRDRIFVEALTSPLILDPLEALLGPNIDMVLNRHNHATVTLKGAKPPRLHRDILQWSRSLVTVILYLEKTSVENGCTCVVPGSQYLPFIAKPNNGGTWMDEHAIYADLLNQVVPVPMPEGGILFLDSLMFHAVGINRTDSTRMTLTAGYHSVDELAGAFDDSKRVLVRGIRIYKGNDLASHSSRA